MVVVVEAVEVVEAVILVTATTTWFLAAMPHLRLEWTLGILAPVKWRGR